MIADRFKIRASAAGQLMTNGRAKGSMGETAKNYIKNWLLEQPEFFDMRVNEFSSIQIDKGNAVEADSLDFIGTQKYDGAFFVPNVKHFEDDFMTGTPDLIVQDHTADNKASWLARTFPFFDTELKNKDYFWQGQVYMHLTGSKRHVVYYTLMNTPLELIDRAAYRRAYDLGFPEPTVEIYKETESKMTYDHIEPSKRIKAFWFDYSEDAILDLISRVKVAREYINELCQQIENDK